MSNQAGKGDDPRPVNGERYRTNYERIFGKRESAKGKDDKPSIPPLDVPSHHHEGGVRHFGVQ
jgi:hypothetical protein